MRQNRLLIIFVLLMIVCGCKMIIPNSYFGVLKESERIYNYIISDTLEQKYYFSANFKLIDNKLQLKNTSDVKFMYSRDSITDWKIKNSNAKYVLSLYRLMMNESGYLDSNIRVINSNSSKNPKKLTYLANVHGRKYRIRVETINRMITSFELIAEQAPNTKNSYLQIIKSKR